MSYKTKRVYSSFTFQCIRLIYLSLFIFYIFCGLLFFTNGSLNTILMDNLSLILFPIIIPVIFSFFGVYRFSFQEKNGLMEFKSSCMLLGHFNNSFRNELIIPSQKIADVNLDSSFLGLRRTLQIKFVGNKKIYKKRFNISLLTSSETKLLKSYLNNNFSN